jgi:hypothetical protein
MALRQETRENISKALLGSATALSAGEAAGSLPTPVPEIVAFLGAAAMVLALNKLFRASRDDLGVREDFSMNEDFVREELTVREDLTDVHP